MSTGARIAVVWALPSPATAVTDALARRSPAPLVRVFPDLVTAADEIRRFRPDLIALAHESPDLEEAGMLRVLCRLCGSAALVAAPAAARAPAEAIAQRLAAPFLALPATPDAVLAAVEQALRQPPPDDHAALVTLIRGIADEIHNPLQVALGYLRLLDEEVAAGSVAAGKVDAIRRSLLRIQATVRRAQLVQRAQEAGASQTVVDLAALLAELAPEVAVPPAAVRGDPELLRLALRDLLALGRDLAAPQQPGALRVHARPDRITVTLELPAVKLDDWRLPRTFDPYYLDASLRGTSHGLGAFTLRIIAEAHGGRALARRRPAGGFVITIELPAA